MSLKNGNDANTEKLDISIAKIEAIVRGKIASRHVMKKDLKIYVGENSKQIENGYYDLKMHVENDSYIVNINKLWKSFSEKLYEEEYVLEVADSIANILDEKGEKEDIYNYILSGYISAKSSDNLENQASYNLNLGKYTFAGIIAEKEFVMTITKK